MLEQCRRVGRMQWYFIGYADHQYLNWLAKKQRQYLPVTSIVLPSAAMPFSTSSELSPPRASSVVLRAVRFQVCTTLCWAMLMLTTRLLMQTLAQMYCWPLSSIHSSSLMQTRGASWRVMERVCWMLRSQSVTQMWLEPSLMKMWELLWVMPQPSQFHPTSDASQNLPNSWLNLYLNTVCYRHVRKQNSWFLGKQIEPYRKQLLGKRSDLQVVVSALLSGWQLWIWKQDLPQWPQDQSRWVWLMNDSPWVQQRESCTPIFQEILACARPSTSSSRHRVAGRLREVGWLRAAISGLLCADQIIYRKAGNGMWKGNCMLPRLYR